MFEKLLFRGNLLSLNMLGDRSQYDHLQLHALVRIRNGALMGRLILFTAR